MTKFIENCGKLLEKYGNDVLNDLLFFKNLFKTLNSFYLYVKQMPSTLL